MSLVRLFGMATLCLLPFTAPARAADNDAAAVRQAMEGLYARIDAASEAGDGGVLTLLSLPDATVEASGLSTPMSTIADLLKKLVSDGTKIRAHSVIQSVEFVGEDAVVSVTTDTTYIMGAGQKSYASATRDTWTRVAAADWRLKSVLVQSQRITAPPTDAKTAQAVAAELKVSAQALTTVEAGNPYGDLAAFGKAVGNARIVSLGEATHGTREFFQMKHRLLEYLVREKGFTVFGIEANWPESQAVDRYIKTGEGDPKAAIAAMYFWTWNTEEVLDMIEWMRAYNAAPGQHPVLSFTSFDMQTAGVAAKRVLDYLNRTDPQAAQTAQGAYQDLGKLNGDPSALGAGTAAGIAQAAEAVVRTFDEKRDAMIAASSPDAWRDARQTAVIVQQAAINLTPESGSGYRDEMMARNTEWLADKVYPNQKIVLWAHNGHVTFSASNEYKLMGTWLRERFGTDMYVLGFAFQDGTVRAIGDDRTLKNHPVPASPEGSGDAVFASAGMPMFFLDMRSVGTDGVLGRWLADTHLYRSIGALWPEQNPESMFDAGALSQTYDGVIFIKSTHPAVGLPALTSAQ